MNRALARRSLIAIAALSAFGALPATAAAPPFNEFPLVCADSQPRGITAGPDGALWFTEFNSTALHASCQNGATAHANGVARIAPGGGAIKEFPLANTNAGPRGITTGPDGALWFTEYKANAIGRIDTAGAVTEFPLAALPAPGEQPRGIAAGPDGDLWFTEFGTSAIGRLDPRVATPKRPQIAEFRAAGSPRGIVAGPDGAMWFADDVKNEIGRITTDAKPVVNEFPIPTANSGPRNVAVGPGGIWFTEGLDNKVGVIDTNTHAIAEYVVGAPLAAPSVGPDGIAQGPDNAMWFVELTANKLGRVDAITHAISEFAVPTAASAPDSITLGPDSALWFTESKGNQIGCFATGATPARACVSAVPAPGAPAGTGTGGGTTGTGTGTAPGGTGGNPPGGTGGGAVTPLSGKALAKKLAACAQLKGTAKARCLAQAHYGAALARCETRKGKKGKASCRKKALIAYKRELAAIKCQSITSKSKRAACLRKARRIH